MASRIRTIVDLTVIIVSWNTRELLRRCLQTLLAEISGIAAEAFVIDNDSADGSAEMVAAEFPAIKLIANKTNRGFAAANNQVLKDATSKFVLLLNPDTEVKPGAIKTLINFLETHPKAGIVAPQLLNTDGSIQRSCRRFPSFKGMAYELAGLSKLFPSVSRFKEYKMLEWEHDDEREVDQPEGACLMVRQEVIKQVGILDEGFFMLFEEVDWCYRIKQAGWQIWFTTSARVVHHHGQAIKQVKARMILSSHRGLYRYWRKHLRGRRWYLDLPAYSGLMLLAYLRIASHSVRNRLRSKPIAV